MEFDPFLLARLQFAANISFHILFPTITIGLCWVLFCFRLRYTFSGDKAWEYAYFFWVKIFALSFALGVVSGITMSFQFGTNWPGFMERAGNIAGPLLGYEASCCSGKIGCPTAFTWCPVRWWQWAPVSPHSGFSA